MDSILDAVYFLHLGSEYTLVHMPAPVLKLMCAFLFIAALKDILIGWLIKLLHEDGAQPKIEIEQLDGDRFRLTKKKIWMKIQEPIRKKEKKTTNQNEKEVLEVQEANVQIFHFDHNHSGNDVISHR